jgi:hypothetical protein
MTRSPGWWALWLLAGASFTVLVLSVLAYVSHRLGPRWPGDAWPTDATPTPTRATAMPYFDVR